MTIALFVIAAVCLLGGWFFYYMNANSPLQTPFPLFLLPTGVVAAIVWLTRVL